MDQPLIVLIDPDARKIFLYGEYNREFLLEELHVLKAFLKDRNVMYVTQATEVTCDEMVETADAILEQLEPAEPVKRFFRVNIDGFTNIPEVRERFAGPKDCKPLERFSKDIFDKSPTMTKLLKSGKLEILSEDEVLKVKKPRPKEAPKSILLEQKIRNADGEIIFESPDSIFTPENEIGEETVVETDEEEAIRKGFGKSE